MTSINIKKHRIINAALANLYKPKAFITWDTLKSRHLQGESFLRQIRVDNNQYIFLSDDGMKAMRTIVSTIDSSNIFQGRASYPDIWSAWIDIFQDLLEVNQQPENSIEIVQLICDKLANQISLHTFAVPVFGVELVDIDSVNLGSMKLQKLTVEYLDLIGVKHDHADVQKSIEATKYNVWLVGSVMGTSRVARQKFSHQAELAMGMLAISAASIYVKGATAFRIGVVMSPEQGHGGAIWFSWSENQMSIITTCSYVSHQLFKIDHALLNQFSSTKIFDEAFFIFEKTDRNELEDAIVKCVYWYSEAQRDSVNVMKFVKYWSCIEVFFSWDKEEITQSVSAGLTSVLVYGGFKFIPSTDYASFKRKIKSLYAFRSEAVHAAAYTHISEQDVSDLSQWVAWLLINMIEFVRTGFKTRAMVKEQCDRLDLCEANIARVTPREDE